MFKKLAVSIAVLMFSTNCSHSETITKTIKSLNINPSAISVSVKDVKDGSVVYAYNDKTPRNPASTLKLITTSAAVDTLGSEYKFTTKLYKSTNNDLYLKLGADPFLKSSDLTSMFLTAKNKNIIEPKNIYIDDTVFDKIEWGEGWQWDDELNPLMQKFSAYNLDKNLLNIEIIQNGNNIYPNISIKPFYPMVIMNYATLNSNGANNITIEKNNIFASNVINIVGNATKPQTLIIPVQNPKIYFKMRLEEAINKQKIINSGIYKNAKLPDKNIYLVSQTDNNLSDALTEILNNSNNMIAETVFKLAGAKHTSSQGTLENSLKMLSDYLDKVNINSSDINIVDGSGVSKNNLMTTDFMSEFLVKNYQNDIINKNLPTPGQGTLKNRMLYFKDNLKAKTGTLTNISAIAGYIETRKGKIYAFDIMINDAKTSPSDKKNIEEQIIRQIYIY